MTAAPNAAGSRQIERMPMLKRLWAAALVATAGCGDNVPAGASPDAAVLTIPDAGPPAVPVPRPNVQIRIDPGASGCADGCLEGYESFADRHAEHARPVESMVLESRLQDLFVRPEATMTDLSSEALRAAIVDGLGTGFLFDGAWDRPLTATLYRVELETSYERWFYRFDDLEVGAFDVRVLMPLSAAPHPVILALHGHGEDGLVMEERFMGRDLVEQGYAVVLPQFRAMDCGSPVEGQISMALLRQGFTLMGLQVYEALLARKFIEVADMLDPRRVGLLSHSGGSSTANLLVFIEPLFDAQVTDYLVDWRNRCPTIPIGVHCETVEALFEFGPQIAMPDGLPLYRIAVPYGFLDPTLRSTISRFFDEHVAQRSL